MINSSDAIARLILRTIFFGAFISLLIGCNGGGGQQEGLPPSIKIQSIPQSQYNSTIFISLNIASYSTAKANLNIDYMDGEQDSWHKTTALPGRPNPINAPSINLPNGNLRVDFWWHAIADLGQNEKHEGVYIRISVSTEDGAYTFDTIGPMVFNYQKNPDSELPPYVPGGDLPTAFCGGTYETQLGITGGDAPVVWKLIPPGTQLPPFLELTWNGIVRGTIPEYYGPTTVKFTALATDSNDIVKRESAGAFNIEIKCAKLNEPPPAISFNSIPNAQVGEFYSYQATATGGLDELEWSISAGNPPGWLDMTTDGLLYGTPDPGSIGQYLITIKVCDSHPNGSRCDTREYAFQVLPAEIDCGDPPSIATSSLEPIYEKVAMEPVQLQVSG
ncbi:MAG: Ig domain-containing protein, partial [bacterium]